MSCFARSEFRASCDVCRQNAIDSCSFAVRAAGVHIYLALGLLQAKHHDEAVAQLRTAKMLDPIAANDILTRALHMQPDPGNLDVLLLQLQQ